ncbi:MAG: hypothetical protein WCO44_12875 [Bacteroidota bacterium]
MKTEIRTIFVLLLISSFGCVYDYGVIREKCSIPIQKDYFIPLDKETLFTKIQFGYTVSDTLKKNLLDSLFYFSIHDPVYHNEYLGASFVLLCSVNQIAPGNTKIGIKQLLEINGRIPEKVLESDVKIVKGMTRNELIQFVEQNFICHLKTPDSIWAEISVTKIYFDNKELVDAYINGLDK